MQSILEVLLVKGDYHLEKQLQQQEFSLESIFYFSFLTLPDYLKLLYEIRKLVVPKLESADGYDFNIEWRSQDFKQVNYYNKKFIKYRSFIPQKS